MAPEQSHNKHDGQQYAQKHKNSSGSSINLDQEVREMILALTNRLTSIQRTSNHQGAEDDINDGVKIITLAGSNLGATLCGSGEIDDKVAPPQGPALPEDFTTYVNSNFQAVNNSILLGATYETNDPGVHLDISDHAFEHTNTSTRDHGLKHTKGKRHNENGSSESNQHSED